MGSNAKHFRIAVDLDGVVYKWSDTARWLLLWKFGVEVGESQHWSYIEENVTEQQWAWLWQDDEDGGIGRGLFRHGHCYKGSFEALKELDQIGDIVTITHRPKAALNDTLQWLAFHRVPTSAVHLLYREESKSSVQPHCQVYVDDKMENCIDLFENTEGLVCLWDRPWNQHQQKGMPKGIKIVHTWDEFVQLTKEKAWELHPTS